MGGWVKPATGMNSLEKKECQCRESKHDFRSSSPYLNPLNAESNPICHLMALLRAHHILHISRLRVNSHTDWDIPGSGSFICSVAVCLYCYTIRLTWLSKTRNALFQFCVMIWIEKLWLTEWEAETVAFFLLHIRDVPVYIFGYIYLSFSSFYSVTKSKS